MAGGKSFTKVDLSQAYLQIPIDDSSKELLVINTPKGLFHYTQMPYGISAAPRIFQRFMENVLHGLSHVVAYIDDILITGGSEEDRLKTLALVLARLDNVGIQLRKSKCEFKKVSVTYLGHQIDQHGLHPLKEKVQAVQEAPASKT